MLEILLAVWHHDFETLQQVSSLKWFLFLLAAILFLESSFVFLPLPGDSLVLFVGGMIGLGILDFYSAGAALCAAASLGSICAYFQGRVLHKTPFVSYLERILPDDSLPKAHRLLNKYGFASLFISRFVPFVRVLTPMLMGIAKLNPLKTVLISISSSLIWCLVLLLAGKWIMTNPALDNYQQLLSKGVVVISLSMMLLAIIGLVHRAIKNNKKNPFA
ncbi:DedA family protein [Vibrio sp. ZSDZ34]|jgi:membrane protein DedA with SNARE-associated domain|uniref:DedA family protein n=1 Tax=Vibrio gelatinilyticus TaxID=2893468 RepID=A0A9X1WEN7_9VIBR|nr:DedA family protein [Vibrio gelatinilyticus]MCJ2376935.1 DedA family protein [Vibrio gelatinilyticus]